ncbi:MAG TPA: hypothetical protein VMJ30_04145 [Gemmatimonadales bacterium]|nr:hypothetical protein [Gemmatimonadales bacterium]
MQGPEVLIPISFFFSVGAVIILRGPLGKAIADRIAGRTGRDDDDYHSLRGEVDELRGRLAETEERLDFAERLLSNPQSSDREPRSPRN